MLKPTKTKVTTPGCSQSRIPQLHSVNDTEGLVSFKLVVETSSQTRDHAIPNTVFREACPGCPKHFGCHVFGITRFQPQSSRFTDSLPMTSDKLKNKHPHREHTSTKKLTICFPNKNKYVHQKGDHATLGLRSLRARQMRLAKKFSKLLPVQNPTSLLGLLSKDV